MPNQPPTPSNLPRNSPACAKTSSPSIAPSAPRSGSPSSASPSPSNPCCAPPASKAACSPLPPKVNCTPSSPPKASRCFSAIRRRPSVLPLRREGVAGSQGGPPLRIRRRRATRGPQAATGPRATCRRVRRRSLPQQRRQPGPPPLSFRPRIQFDAPRHRAEPRRSFGMQRLQKGHQGRGLREIEIPKQANFASGNLGFNRVIRMAAHGRAPPCLRPSRDRSKRTWQSQTWVSTA